LPLIVEVARPNYLHRATVPGTFEAIELQHQIEGVQQRSTKAGVRRECGDVIVGQQRRRGIRPARFRKWEQPLNVVVMRLELIEAEPEDVAQ